jgi:hypothetical protein
MGRLSRNLASVTRGASTLQQKDRLQRILRSGRIQRKVISVLPEAVSLSSRTEDPGRIECRVGRLDLPRKHGHETAEISPPRSFSGSLLEIRMCLSRRRRSKYFGMGLGQGQKQPAIQQQAEKRCHLLLDLFSTDPLVCLSRN